MVRGVGSGPAVGGGPQVKKFERVQAVVTWGPVCGQTDRQTRLKTLPSHNFAGGR